MDDILQDDQAARRAIPDLGYDWPNGKLKALGMDVQAQYPELTNWPPYLAAEAHLLYTRRLPGDPSIVSPRSAEFLAFLRAAVAGHVHPSSAVGAHS
jgi:hypothetical protein